MVYVWSGRGWLRVQVQFMSAKYLIGQPACGYSVLAHSAKSTEKLSLGHSVLIRGLKVSKGLKNALFDRKIIFCCKSSLERDYSLVTLILIFNNLEINNFLLSFFL